MNPLSSLTVGQQVLQWNDTIWGVRREAETVAAIRHTRDGLVEVELRKGSVLMHLLRGSPDTVVRVLH